MKTRARILNASIAAASIAALLLASVPAQAAAPVGADTFQLLASPQTGSDNTGDGGTGLGADLNYYYVGQTFTTEMEIVSGGTTSANIWIDYDGTMTTASSLVDGDFFPSFAGQDISGSRVKITGFRVSGTSSGTGTLGEVDWTVVEPNALSLDESTPQNLDINVGTIGLTTESNISLSGVDILDDEEDFGFHAWADVTDPYGLNPNPSNGAVGIVIDSNFTFDLRDSKNGEGDDSGVGTGVNTASAGRFINFDDGGGDVSELSNTSYSCSGTWGTNLCVSTVNPDPPSGIPGDTRNFEYDTTYTVTVGGFDDLASSAQDQLGEANGPNTMATKVWTFTTEADTVPPQVTAESPARSSAGNPVNTNLVIDVEDRKSYPNGPSGVGVDSSTCRINVSSASFPLTTYDETDAEVVVTDINYGKRFTIDPATDFGVNETVSVSVYDCADTEGNVMVTDNYTFTTNDTVKPYVDQRSPINDATINENGTITFHIKDDGGGVNLASVVVFVNGVYYTAGGGAGSVTTNDTDISFADSLDLNGANYVGDTTEVSGTPQDYTFTIDPEGAFAEGEPIPVLIYAQDNDGNLLDRDVFALVAESSCTVVPPPSGSTGSAGGGGGGFPPPEINSSTFNVVQVDEDSVLVSWLSNYPGSARVLYDFEPQDDLTNGPNKGYRFSTPEYLDDSMHHAVLIEGLENGRLYYFRPITLALGLEAIGPERAMAPKFATRMLPTECPVQEPETVTIEVPVAYCPEGGDGGASVPTAPVQAPPFLKVTEIRPLGEGYILHGRAAPGAAITINVY